MIANNAGKQKIGPMDFANLGDGVVQVLLSICLHCFILSLSVLFQRYLLSNDAEHEELFDLISRMLEYEPSQRLVLADALDHPFFQRLPALLRYARVTFNMPIKSMPTSSWQLLRYVAPGK